MAGSIIVTSADIGGGVARYTIAWTSDASGAVTANTAPIRRGHLNQWKTIPNSGGTAPSDPYALTLLDGDGVDVLAGAGAALSGSVAAIGVPGGPPLIEAGNLTPTIAGAGNAKGGTLILYIGP